MLNTVELNACVRIVHHPYHSVFICSMKPWCTSRIRQAPQTDETPCGTHLAALEVLPHGKKNTAASLTGSIQPSNVLNKTAPLRVYRYRTDSVDISRRFFPIAQSVLRSSPLYIIATHSYSAILRCNVLHQVSLSCSIGVLPYKSSRSYLCATLLVARSMGSI